MATMLNGAAVMDAALLLIAGEQVILIFKKIEYH
jgi:translation initiation factor 2 gamma subunit (eIF-2gamma)